ncbi:MAG: FHA domain-containing protein [Gammaproteobacteria bacterium]|nr:FHA domain-containing protein [Gammaproteobacteria bacterium]NNF48560.1 FHA domain-containing protein [Woeseiaceae bacterium]MBT8095202.1 FHA domain-containing protein [Gammaproteobacteria bacterium]MBT8105360.1 FHA domain-containing protein [Gammaproteobacteria bacterium]NNK25374.1 FHA domain-containing protein [Woeseiaceae bacterium]
MARLILSLDNQVLAEYNMTKERYTIGRLPDNDVRIDNPAVSGHHSLIINILNDSFLEDLNSTNGTYVNGKLIKKHALQHGDVITIGHHQLRFSDQQAPETEQDEFESTMVIPSGQQNAEQLAKAEAAADMAAAAATQPDEGAVATSVMLDDEDAEALKQDAEPKRHADTMAETVATGTAAGISVENAPNALPLAKLQVLSGAFAGRELELTKALTTLGRPGVQVAAITRRAEGYFIVHVESGKTDDFPLVNGKPIGQQARELHDHDVVQLAGVKMGFFAD